MRVAIKHHNFAWMNDRGDPLFSDLPVVVSEFGAFAGHFTFALWLAS
jgi:hypothetical protein